MSVPSLRFFLAATVLMLMTFPLHANPVLPGGTVAPDIFTTNSEPPLLGDINGNFDFNFNGAHLKGMWEAVVLVDPFGVTCSGCLDFAYQVTLDPDSYFVVGQLGVSRFFGYSTDVGYVDEGDVPPSLVNRGPAGGGVFFQFSSAVSQNQSNAILVVATNSKTFDTGGGLQVFGTDGVHNVNGQITGIFEPTQAPEPSSALLLSLGLAGIAAFRRLAAPRRSRN